MRQSFAAIVGGPDGAGLARLHLFSVRHDASFVVSACPTMGEACLGRHGVAVDTMAPARANPSAGCEQHAACTTPPFTSPVNGWGLGAGDWKREHAYGCPSPLRSRQSHQSLASNPQPLAQEVRGRGGKDGINAAQDLACLLGGLVAAHVRAPLFNDFYTIQRPRRAGDMRVTPRLHIYYLYDYRLWAA